MKKAIILLLTLALSLSMMACSSEISKQTAGEKLKVEQKANDKKNNEEVNKKEVKKEEVKKAQVNKEEEVKDKTESKKKEKIINENIEKKENVEDIQLLKGKLVWCYFYKGIGIELDEKQEILGKEVEAVYFGEDTIKDLIPREYMTFLSQAGTYLDEDFNKQIELQVKINPNSYSYDSDFDVTFVDLIEVISLDGEVNPTDKTKDEYPIDYWKDVFYALIRDVEFLPTEDIKDYGLYKAEKDFGRSDMFRTAVDKILERGLYIQLVEGKYEINETKKESPKADTEGATIL